MLKKLYYKYILIIFFGLSVTHLVFSYFLGIATSYFYDDFMINVRNFPSKESKSLAESYLKTQIKSAKKPLILFLGTSFSYGYGLAGKDTYSHLLALKFPTYTFLNASVIGESGSGILDKLLFLKKNNIHVDTVVIELNLFNLTSRPIKIHSKQLKTQKPSFENLFLFYLLNPHGLNSLSYLDLNNLYAIGPYAGQHSYLFANLPDNYSKKYSDFQKSFASYQELFNYIFSISKTVATNTYFFISPIYSEAIKKTQFKLGDIKNELRDLNQLCKQTPDIHCLDLGLQSQETYFLNLSHYNEEGHRNLTKVLVKVLQGNI